MALSAISLFSGAGMLDEGLRAGLDYLGIAHRTICHVEREAHAAAVLVARMEEGSLDAAPIWSDVTTFNATAWRGRVDCVVAGFPCQDISVAGKRAGLDGHRSGLFYEVIRIAVDCDAEFLVLENVGGIASATATVMDEAEGELLERAAARVVGELADLGWDAEWLHLSASDVGASHGRERWFCLAWRELADPPRHVGNGSGDGETGSWRGVCQAGDALANTEGRRGQRERKEFARGTETESPSNVMGNAARYRRHEGRTELSWRPRRSNSRRPGVPVAYADPSGRRAGRIAECLSPDAKSVGVELADSGHRTRADESKPVSGRGHPADDCPGCRTVADAGRPRPQGNEQQSAHDQDGRTDGRTDGAGTMPISCRIS